MRELAPPRPLRKAQRLGIGACFLTLAILLGTGALLTGPHLEGILNSWIVEDVVVDGTDDAQYGRWVTQGVRRPTAVKVRLRLSLIHI